jgi:hypothetical protein
MSARYRNVLALLLAGFSFKFAAFFTGVAEEYAVHVYLLLLTVAAFISVQEVCSTDSAVEYFTRLKVSLQPVVLFCVFTAGFTWFFYALVDTGFMQVMQDERINLAQQAGLPEDNLEALRQNLQVVFSPQIHSLIVGAILMGYGILATAVFNFLLPRFKA